METTKRTIELKGALCNYCENPAEFVTLNAEELPMCFACVELGADK